MHHSLILIRAGVFGHYQLLQAASFKSSKHRGEKVGCHDRTRIHTHMECEERARICNMFEVLSDLKCLADAVGLHSLREGVKNLLGAGYLPPPSRQGAGVGATFAPMSLFNNKTQNILALMHVFIVSCS